MASSSAMLQPLFILFFRRVNHSSVLPILLQNVVLRVHMLRTFLFNLLNFIYFILFLLFCFCTSLETYSTLNLKKTITLFIHISLQEQILVSLLCFSYKSFKSFIHIFFIKGTFILLCLSTLFRPCIKIRSYF